MNLYRVSQSVNSGYDTYSDAVVAAPSEEAAKKMHPQDGSEVWLLPDEEGQKRDEERDDWESPSWYTYRSTWANRIEDVQVEYIGKARAGTKKGVICASFHAG